MDDTSTSSEALVNNLGTTHEKVKGLITPLDLTLTSTQPTQLLSPNSNLITPSTPPSTPNHSTPDSNNSNAHTDTTSEILDVGLRGVRLQTNHNNNTQPSHTNQNNTLDYFSIRQRILSYTKDSQDDSLNSSNHRTYYDTNYNAQRNFRWQYFQEPPPYESNYNNFSLNSSLASLTTSELIPDPKMSNNLQKNSRTMEREELSKQHIPIDMFAHDNNNNNNHHHIPNQNGYLGMSSTTVEHFPTEREGADVGSWYFSSTSQPEIEQTPFSRTSTDQYVYGLEDRLSILVDTLSKDRADKRDYFKRQIQEVDLLLSGSDITQSQFSSEPTPTTINNNNNNHQNAVSNLPQLPFNSIQKQKLDKVNTSLPSIVITLENGEIKGNETNANHTSKENNHDIQNHTKIIENNKNEQLEIKKFKDQIRVLEQANNGLGEALKRRDVEINELRNIARQALDEAESNRHIHLKYQDVEKRSFEVESREREVIQAKKLLDEKEGEVLKERKQLEVLRAELEKEAKRQRDFESDINTKQDENLKMAKSLDTLKLQLDKRQEEFNAMEEKLSFLEEERESNNQKITELETRFKEETRTITETFQSEATQLRDKVRILTDHLQKAEETHRSQLSDLHKQLQVLIEQYQVVEEDRTLQIEDLQKQLTVSQEENARRFESLDAALMEREKEIEKREKLVLMKEKELEKRANKTMASTHTNSLTETPQQTDNNNNNNNDNDIINQISTSVSHLNDSSFSHLQTQTSQTKLLNHSFSSSSSSRPPLPILSQSQPVDVSQRVSRSHFPSPQFSSIPQSNTNYENTNASMAIEKENPDTSKLMATHSTLFEPPLSEIPSTFVPSLGSPSNVNVHHIQQFTKEFFERRLAPHKIITSLPADHFVPYLNTASIQSQKNTPIPNQNRFPSPYRNSTEMRKSPTPQHYTSYNPTSTPLVDVLQRVMYSRTGSVSQYTPNSSLNTTTTTSEQPNFLQHLSFTPHLHSETSTNTLPQHQHQHQQQQMQSSPPRTQEQHQHQQQAKKSPIRTRYPPTPSSSTAKRRGPNLSSNTRPQANKSRVPKK